MSVKVFTNKNLEDVVQGQKETGNKTYPNYTSDSLTLPYVLRRSLVEESNDITYTANIVPVKEDISTELEHTFDRDFVICNLEDDLQTVLVVDSSRGLLEIGSPTFEATLDGCEYTYNILSKYDSTSVKTDNKFEVASLNLLEKKNKSFPVGNVSGFFISKIDNPMNNITVSDTTFSFYVDYKDYVNNHNDYMSLSLVKVLDNQETQIDLRVVGPTIYLKDLYTFSDNRDMGNLREYLKANNIDSYFGYILTLKNSEAVIFNNEVIYGGSLSPTAPVPLVTSKFTVLQNINDSLSSNKLLLTSTAAITSFTLYSPTDSTVISKIDLQDPSAITVDVLYRYFNNMLFVFLPASSSYDSIEITVESTGVVSILNTKDATIDNYPLVAKGKIGYESTSTLFSNTEGFMNLVSKTEGEISSKIHKLILKGSKGTKLTLGTTSDNTSIKDKLEINIEAKSPFKILGDIKSLCESLGCSVKIDKTNLAVWIDTSGIYPLNLYIDLDINYVLDNKNSSITNGIQSLLFTGDSDYTYENTNTSCSFITFPIDNSSIQSLRVDSYKSYENIIETEEKVFNISNLKKDYYSTGLCFYSNLYESENYLALEANSDSSLLLYVEDKESMHVGYNETYSKNTIKDGTITTTSVFVEDNTSFKDRSFYVNLLNIGSSVNYFSNNIKLKIENKTQTLSFIIQDKSLAERSLTLDLIQKDNEQDFMQQLIYSSNDVEISVGVDYTFFIKSINSKLKLKIDGSYTVLSSSDYSDNIFLVDSKGTSYE